MPSYITDVDILTATSSVSIPFYQITLPKDESISAEFVYNYYTRDEGISETVTLDAVDDESDQYDFIVENWENSIYPRQVNLTFSTKSKFTPESLADGILENAVLNKNIIYEDEPTNSKFCSAVVHDTSIDEKIYKIISGSTSKRTKKSNDILNVAKLQSLGYRFSKAETRQSVKALYDSDIKSANLPISLNNLFAYDVLNTTKMWQASAYADEFMSILSDALEVQKNERLKSIPTIFSITEDEIDLNLEDFAAVSYISPTATPVDTDSVTRVGFIVEKYGEQLDGTTLKYPDIVLSNSDITTYVDKFVRYGAVYKYKIRTVYKKILKTAERIDTLSFGGFKLYTVLIASTGEFTTVKCVETTPPLPPNNISFQQTLQGLFIRWNFPINPQKDIKRFQIFRRLDVRQPFSLIKEINFDQTILPYTTGENVPNEREIKSKGPIKHYVDDEFNDIDSDYIYSICAIDAHGYSSAYSEQFRVRFDKMTGKLLVTRVSIEGAPKPYPNVNITADFFADVIKDSGHSRVRIYFDPEYRDITRDGTSLNLISTSTTAGSPYRLSMTEINLGQSQVININIDEPIVTSSGIPVSLARFYKVR